MKTVPFITLKYPFVLNFEKYGGKSSWPKPVSLEHLPGETSVLEVSLQIQPGIQTRKRACATVVRKVCKITTH